MSKGHDLHAFTEHRDNFDKLSIKDCVLSFTRLREAQSFDEELTALAQIDVKSIDSAIQALKSIEDFLDKTTAHVRQQNEATGAASIKEQEKNVLDALTEIGNELSRIS
jgi:Zn-dependent oligopeptidase